MSIMKKRVEVFILPSKAQAAQFAAELIASEIRGKKKFNLGLAAGETMVFVYRGLIGLYNAGKISFANVKTFALDEYLSVGEKDKFEYFLDRNLLSKIDIQEGNKIFLNEKNFESYEGLIKKSGGIDLWVLGIGRNGHIAFNEPGSGFKTRTRKVKLREETRRANKSFFKSLKEVPREALTVGIGTILEARKIVLIAFGREKAQAVSESLNFKPRAQWPASALQSHQRARFIVDKSAAEKLGELR